jgi:hypothetical protein
MQQSYNNENVMQLKTAAQLRALFLSKGCPATTSLVLALETPNICNRAQQWKIKQRSHTAGK